MARPCVTPLERMVAAASLQPCDWPPFSDNEWNETPAELVPYLAGCPERPDHTNAEAERGVAVHASLDTVPRSHIHDHPRFPILGPVQPSREGERYVHADGFARVIHGYSDRVERCPFSDLPGFLCFMVSMCARHWAGDVHPYWSTLKVGVASVPACESVDDTEVLPSVVDWVTVHNRAGKRLLVMV